MIILFGAFTLLLYLNLYKIHFRIKDISFPEHTTVLRTVIMSSWKRFIPADLSRHNGFNLFNAYVLGEGDSSCRSTWRGRKLLVLLRTYWRIDHAIVFFIRFIVPQCQVVHNQHHVKFIGLPNF